MWDVLEKGVFYVNRDAVPVTVERFDVATREVSEVAVLEKPSTRYGFSVSPDGWWFFIRLENRSTTSC